MIKKSGILAILFAVVLVISFMGFSQPAEAETIQVGAVFSLGGLGDLSFNDLAYEALENASEDYDVEFDYIEPDSSADFDPSLRRFAERNYDLVLAVGFLQEEEVRQISQEYPHVNFAHVDVAHEPAIDNVRGMLFADHQSSFLVGALSALVTEEDNVGFLGGIDSPLINKFEGGFVQGVEYIAEEDKDIEIQRSYADSFDDAARGREIALGFIDDGADVIYHASGGTGDGLFTAAEEEDIYAIGVDSNQNWISPGHIIASKLKNVDVAVYNTIEDVVKGDFEGGRNMEFDLEVDGVGTTPLESVIDEVIEPELDEEDREAILQMKEEVTAPHAERIEEIREKIIEDEIEIEDWSEIGRQ
ncbi:BMP family lipoprotein [Halarsenatibacter silvermanii]|uniref:Nucleoside-binding protein n=1 Tax=Halarsenatibacter silvermanii TaxID=321763 RepID=A0A1G9NI67_9FIRM|nr:BMP family ABC transporter substrate-binding protein [Halarsenatibacter silvermanii]SDL86288.1 nucleoside-binding protein [Halarsenatibacter silvermanii]